MHTLTTAIPDTPLDLPVRVVSVKASDHKWYGAHDLLVVELTEPAGDLPAGLQFQVRRPHDGTADLRSDDRKGKDELVVNESMKKDELLAIAKRRGVEVSDKATKKEIVAALAA